jgi:hypothetical protein
MGSPRVQTAKEKEEKKQQEKLAAASWILYHELREQEDASSKTSFDPKTARLLDLHKESLRLYDLSQNKDATPDAIKEGIHQLQKMLYEIYTDAYISDAQKKGGHINKKPYLVRIENMMMKMEDYLNQHQFGYFLLTTERCYDNKKTNDAKIFIGINSLPSHIRKGLVNNVFDTVLIALANQDQQTFIFTLKALVRSGPQAIEEWNQLCAKKHAGLIIELPASFSNFVYGDDKIEALYKRVRNLPTSERERLDQALQLLILRLNTENKKLSKSLKMTTNSNIN